MVPAAGQAVIIPGYVQCSRALYVVFLGIT